eukprot:CFRG3752T1
MQICKKMIAYLFWEHQEVLSKCKTNCDVCVTPKDAEINVKLIVSTNFRPHSATVSERLKGCRRVNNISPNNDMVALERYDSSLAEVPDDNPIPYYQKSVSRPIVVRQFCDEADEPNCEVNDLPALQLCNEVAVESEYACFKGAKSMPISESRFMKV